MFYGKECETSSVAEVAVWRYSSHEVLELHSVTEQHNISSPRLATLTSDSET